MDFVPESDDESSMPSPRSSLTGASSISSTALSYYHVYNPTIFEQIVSSQDSDFSMGSVSKVVCGIIDQLSSQERCHDEKTNHTLDEIGATLNEVCNQKDGYDHDDLQADNDCASSQSSESNSDIGRRRQSKADIAKEREQIEKLFGLVCREPLPEVEVSQEPGTKAEQLYLDQCCSWFKRTTRGGNKNRKLIDDIAVEELPRVGGSCKRKRKIMQGGGGDHANSLDQ